jgi:protein tyrosine phosphatase (PTP) superfamily phosphohydrolase (DUF442 family)
MKNITQILNFIQVSPNIATAGQPTKKDFKLIAKEGYDVVINLAMHNRGALKEEDKIVTKYGMLYIHIPIIWEKPSNKRLQLFLKTLQMLEKNNQKVFIHCIKNYRASVFVHRYKKDILKIANPSFVAPAKYTPNKIWQAILDL